MTAEALLLSSQSPSPCCFCTVLPCCCCTVLAVLVHVESNPEQERAILTALSPVLACTISCTQYKHSTHTTFYTYCAHHTFHVTFRVPSIYHPCTMNNQSTVPSTIAHGNLPVGWPLVLDSSQILENKHFHPRSTQTFNPSSSPFLLIHQALQTPQHTTPTSPDPQTRSTSSLLTPNPHLPSPPPNHHLGTTNAPAPQIQLHPTKGHAADLTPSTEEASMRPPTLP